MEILCEGIDIMSKTGIFVDYDNVYDTIEKKYNKEGKIDVHIKFFENLWEKFKNDEVIRFIAFADFCKINHNELLTELQKRSIKLEHCYSNGAKEEYRKNASDLALCISVMKSLYEMQIDKYVLVSSDCDTIPILTELKFKNKETIHIFSPTSSNKDIREYDKDKKWAVISDLFTIEDILGVEVYKDTVSGMTDVGFEELVGKSLIYIFDNICLQRTKKNEYGFGYLTGDIMKATGMVKEDAIKFGKLMKEKEILKCLPDLIDGKFENFRLSKNCEYILKFLKSQVGQAENADIFI